MNKLLGLRLGLGLVVALALGAGCSKKRVAECDAFVATIDKIAKCDKLPAESRKQVEQSATTIKEALKAIDDAGGVGSAPEDLVKQLADTCKTQDKTVIAEYTKLMPECMK